MTPEIPENILLELQQVKEDGRVSMFDKNGVQQIADAVGCWELVTWIEDLDELHSPERTRQFMAALNAMGKLPRGAWRMAAEE